MDGIELIIELIMNVLKSFLLYEVFPIVLINVTKKYYSAKDALKLAIVNSISVFSFITIYCKINGIFYITGAIMLHVVLAILWCIVSFYILKGFQDSNE